jgi:hypothetical protein
VIGRFTDEVRLEALAVAGSRGGPIVAWLPKIFPGGERVEGRRSRSRSDAVGALEAVPARKIPSSGRAGDGLACTCVRRSGTWAAFRGAVRADELVSRGFRTRRRRVSDAGGFGQTRARTLATAATTARTAYGAAQRRHEAPALIPFES